MRPYTEHVPHVDTASFLSCRAFWLAKANATNTSLNTHIGMI